MLRTLAPVALLLAELAGPLAGPAAGFEIFCVDGGDGTQSCQRVDDGGAAITCIDSPGGVRSCTTADGSTVVCVRSRGNVYSCSGEAGPNGTRCQPTGGGTWACDPPAQRSEPLLPGPQLLPADGGRPSLIDTGPAIPRPEPGLQLELETF